MLFSSGIWNSVYLKNNYGGFEWYNCTNILNTRIHNLHFTKGSVLTECSGQCQLQVYCFQISLRAQMQLRRMVEHSVHPMAVWQSIPDVYTNPSLLDLIIHLPQKSRIWHKQSSRNCSASPINNMVRLPCCGSWQVVFHEVMAVISGRYQFDLGLGLIERQVS